MLCKNIPLPTFVQQTCTGLYHCSMGFFNILFSSLLSFSVFTMFLNLLCNSAFEQGHLEPWRYNLFIYLLLSQNCCLVCPQVQHPAAKMLVMASQQQEVECGDGTNFTLIFAGALLENAGELLKMVFSRIGQSL